MRAAGIGIVLLLAGGCGGAARPASSIATPAVAPTSAVEPATLARYRAILDGSVPLPRGADAREVLLGLVPLLAELDPAAVRDGVGYELTARLLLDEGGAVTDADAAALRDMLLARTAVEPTPGDGVFGRVRSPRSDCH
jgi:hypothetical protein